ncbi:MAG: hypothetical protein JWQ83_1472 [Lacunisphaera sp.]|nr:hypothetical protein [Lacunisphaera sp.]MDB6166332.1 hypothetical protein [Lacunisphaera sp.]
MNAWKILLGTAGFLWAAQLGAAEMPKLTAYERSQGWRYLFDGQSLSDWRGYHLNKVPANWQVVEGQLTNGGGPALVTSGDFKDFELSFDWKVSAGGRAEVYYRADEDAQDPAASGPVMQLAGDGVVMGGNGGLSKPWREITLQPDVWYRSKISVFGYQVEHWVNGDRVLTYLIDSPDWRAAVAGSSYKGVRDYGLLTSGNIVFSGTGVMFRNVKIRPL